jgi:hypothetical protein
LVISAMSKPASRMSRSIRRSRWQPPATRLHSGSSRRCQACTRGSGAKPCSVKSSRPPGFSTRRASRRARAASGTLHSVHVETTVSIEPLSSGNSSAEASRYSTGNSAAGRFFLAISSKRVDGSSA